MPDEPSSEEPHGADPPAPPEPSPRLRPAAKRLSTSYIVWYSIAWGVLFALVTGAIYGNNVSEIAFDTAMLVTLMALLQFGMRAFRDRRRDGGR
jgi:hypothetical protein